MKTNGKLAALALLAGLLTSLSLAAAELDFGDHSSSTITAKAWAALGENQPQAAVAYADKCIELYAKEALKMQAGLTDFADEATANDKWALNDVGTCYFIKAQALTKMAQPKAAVAAYGYLTEKLKYAQCWDPNGWFWKPAEAADEALQELKTAAN